MAHRKIGGIALAILILFLILFASSRFALRSSTRVAVKPAAKIVDVTVAPNGEFRFSPETVTINVGDTVRWTWSGSFHTVTSGDTQKCVADNRFCSPTNANCANAPLSNAGAVYTQTFDQPGVYPYFCNPHCSFGMSGTIIVNPAAQTPTVQFSQTAYSVREDAGSVAITVTRTGDTSAVGSVDYATSDGTASARKDYTAAFGTLSFAAGETSKSFNILVIDNGFVDGDRTVNLTFSNPQGVSLGAPASATLTIKDNDSTPSTTNPIDASPFFVRQHYLDFLNREADQAGLNFWTNQIQSCNGDAACIDIKRQNVSAAYFLSREFQETGFFVIRLQRVAFGRVSNDAAKRITYNQFLRDAQAVGNNFIDGQAGADQTLDQNKTAYAQAVAASSDFTSKYPTSLSASAFVDALFSTAGVTPTSQERQDAITAFGSGGTTGRAAALRKAAESDSVKRAEFAPAFVLLQYFGYLRRSPTDPPDTSDAGYQFWLNKLNSFGGDYIRSEMVRSFIVSQEYRQRFGTQ